jgi:pimeloyl-ACP methyl ester carboxylesterase
MNLLQYIDDLDALVDQLKITYLGSKLYLMGHCWGGGFGVAYLIDPTRQAKIAGWIDVAGAHNNPRGDSLSVEWVKAYAHKMVRKGKDVSYWKRALRWYRNNPAFTSDKLSHYGFVRRSSGYQLVHGDTLGKFPGYTKTDLLFRPITFISYYSNYYKTLSSFLISDINLTPLMHKIKIPSLIIWGENDGLIPLPMACEAFESLGTPRAEKQLIMLPDTGHTVYYEQPILFTHAVKAFIKNHEKEVQTYSCGI